jgi:hypothetical protein
MRPPCTFKGLVAILCVMATASGCDESVASTPAQSQAEAATASPLTGKWVDPAPVDANCSLSIEFHEDGSLALGDGHSTRLFDGKVASIDGQGFYKWDGRLRGETGTSQCPSGPDAGTAKAQESIYVRFAEGGARLADGSTLTYFPVIATGHGVIVLWTATVVDSRKSSAVVVQATTSPNCQPSPRADSPRLCTDTKGTMIAVARALAAGPTR